MRPAFCATAARYQRKSGPFAALTYTLRSTTSAHFWVRAQCSLRHFMSGGPCCSGVVGERGGQFAVRVDLRLDAREVLLDAGHGVRAGDESQRQLAGVREGDQGPGELGRVSALLAVHALPRLDGLGGALGVVLDLQFRPDRRRPLDEQLGAEEA